MVEKNGRNLDRSMFACAAPTIQQCLSPLVQFAHKLISTVGLSFLVKLRSQQSSQRYLIKLVPPGFWVTTKVECCYFSPHNATTHLEFHLLASWLAKVAKFANYVILDQSYCACALAELVRNDEMARASSLPSPGLPVGLLYRTRDAMAVTRQSR